MVDIAKTAAGRPCSQENTPLGPQASGGGPDRGFREESMQAVLNNGHLVAQSGAMISPERSLRTLTEAPITY